MDILINNLLNKIKAQYPNMDTSNIEKAYNIASKAHEGQKRKSGEPYIIHPIAVAEILAEMGLDADTITAGILHDCIEDTDFGFELVKKEFGEDIAFLVDGVTRLGKIEYSKEQEQVEDLRKMFMAMAQDIRVIIIKLADRLHNIRTIIYKPINKQRDTALETMEIYAPIAHRLGMQRIKWELEDLSLQVLDPIGYKEITEGLDEQSTKRELFIGAIRENVGAKLSEVKIEHTIEARVKHIYSIYRKMYSQHKTMDEIYDICAMRVIVNSVADCYNVLGYVHDIYKPIPGRFKDYISTPKPNGYRSLHTTVIGRAGIPFEIQIRTGEMHKMAELGVAAHWKYKQGLDRQANEEAFAWIRQLLEAQQVSESEDFLKTIKVDLFADEVFVFTPKGEVINMPAGATPIDFAYAIHSAVGNRMNGCKINSKMAPIDSTLKNGDIVEIITTKDGVGEPKRGWLKIVKTSEARNKIKQWFKKECREENIIQGKQELERELRAALFYNNFMENEDIKQNVLKKCGLPNMEELYATIGYGGITLTKVMNKIKDDVTKFRKQQEREKGPAPVLTPRKSIKSQSGVIVEGLDNCLVKFARCCTPIPGDDIIGFITKGYGVSIHRRDCVNVTVDKDGESSRWVNVWWDEHILQNKSKFTASLQVSAKTRMGVLADILAIFTATKTPVLEVNAKDLADGYTIINLVVEITSMGQLDSLITKTRNIKNVIDTIRT